MKGGASCHPDEVGKAPIGNEAAWGLFHLQGARKAVLKSGGVRQAGLLGGRVERRRSSVGGDHIGYKQ